MQYNVIGYNQWQFSTAIRNLKGYAPTKASAGDLGQIWSTGSSEGTTPLKLRNHQKISPGLTL